MLLQGLGVGSCILGLVELMRQEGVFARVKQASQSMGGYAINVMKGASIATTCNHALESALTAVIENASIGSSNTAAMQGKGSKQASGINVVLNLLAVQEAEGLATDDSWSTGLSTRLKEQEESDLGRLMESHDKELARLMA